MIDLLTAKENMRECIKGGNPDRFVNQFEGLAFLFHPFLLVNPTAKKGEMNVENLWGVYYSYPENVPAGFPVHTPDKIVVKDIEHWRDYVKIPSLDFPDELWGVCKQMYDDVDGTKAYKATFIAPGLFEQCHHLCEISNALEYLMIYEDEMHDLIKTLTEWELKLAEGICSHLHPDAIFHHDDWGSETNSFMRPSMFEDYFLDAYKQIYGYYHDHGVELVFHHSDSYCANLVPDMIEMGIDVWQGCMRTNHTADLVKQYGGQISFMGDIDNKLVDFTGWTQADCDKAARDSMEACGMKYFIPCITQGGPGSLYPGSYKGLWDAIDNYNKEKFGIEDPDSARLPISIMF